MLVLFESPGGYAIFKLLDEKKLQETDNLYRDFKTPEKANKILKLKHFEKFVDTTEALAATTAAVEGKISKSLKKILKKLVSDEVQDKLAVADAKLGNAIKDKLSLQCVSNSSVLELIRCIRSQSESLLAGLTKKELSAMALGLAHSLSRYKLKFSPDKVDTMIVQAICLLDELDKELNNYVMRCREWYGWHFPELGKIITDNVAFTKTIKLIGTRENTATTDLSDILPEEVEEKVKEAAEISMGTEITEEDIMNIHHLCDQVIEVSAYRTQLYEYLCARMTAIAPNFTTLIGELVGARLISHAGSLVNLAKHPASTVQILGAEKALFRALKAKKDTPKYGLIFHSAIVGQASTMNKGKISRTLAAKVSLACRVDALGDDTIVDFGAEHKAKVEARLRFLEEGNLKKISGSAKVKAKFEKYHTKSEVVRYSDAADSTLPAKKRKLSESPSKGDLPLKKIKKESEFEIKQEAMSDGEGAVGGETTSKKKKKKKIKQEPVDESMGDVSIKEEPQDQGATGEGSTKKKKKKVKQEAVEMEVEPSEPAPEESVLDAQGSSQKKKKKKKSKAVAEDE
ncbi:nucleolar protein 58-like [Macrosteles quadrilineatus]|uniref:nucleolar protein 58-like n=1 Tax=Macrosteles quadrilineatus TaxID=74068 RepID=UPI0023E22250|nr:nucleolar protein 58-like [Macrosteles quadrilineatus]